MLQKLKIVYDEQFYIDLHHIHSISDMTSTKSIYQQSSNSLDSCFLDQQYARKTYFTFFYTDVYFGFN